MKMKTQPPQNKKAHQDEGFIDCYHDNYLVEIKADPFKRYLELIFLKDANHSIIKFYNVKRCLINDFTIGNIISKVEMFTKNKFTQKISSNTYFKKMFFLPNEINIFNSTIEEISRGDLLYIGITSSYGCSVDIICERIQQEKILS